MSLGAIAHTSLVQEVRATLDQQYPDDHVRAPGRVASHTENGLALLFRWMEDGFFSGVNLERCRTVAIDDPRFSFVYNLPSSAGFGLAIGATLSEAIFGPDAQHTEAKELTALLQVFMTVLDGMLDEVPQSVAHFEGQLLTIITNPGATISTHEDHPFIHLCCEITRKWSLAAYNSPQPQYRAAFFAAAAEAMTAEYYASEVSLCSATGVPREELLYGRTRWPHWTQALACLLYSAPPRTFDMDAYRALIFSIADYVAFLDDIRDYVEDFNAKRWNTVSGALFRQRPFVPGLQGELLIRLGDDRIIEWIVNRVLEMRAGISKAVLKAGLPSSEILQLVGDMSHASLL